MRQVSVTVCGLLMLAPLAWSACASAPARSPVARATEAAMADRIWQDPGDTASLDLTYGSGGKARAPDPAGVFTFVEEDALATSPKFDVVDGQGVVWKVKLGQESQAETAATRFLWAAGYFTDDDYYLAELAVKGLPTMRRGQGQVFPGGIVHGARLERKRAEGAKLGNWDWFDNPFVGQRELNGLRVMMALVNNWDLKADNNAIYLVEGEHRYTVSDAGATFGRTGAKGVRTKNEPANYRDSTFIAKDRPDRMNFVLDSRPFFLSIFATANYVERARMEQITKHIPRADAKWLGQRLARLRDGQIRDGFRAAGYGPANIEILTKALRLRIAALEAL